MNEESKAGARFLGRHSHDRPTDQKEKRVWGIVEVIINELRQEMMQRFAMIHRLDDSELLRLGKQLDEWIVLHQRAMPHRPADTDLMSADCGGLYCVHGV